MTLTVRLTNSYGDIEILKNVILINDFYEVVENTFIKYMRITFINHEVSFYNEKYSLYSVVMEE